MDNEGRAKLHDPRRQQTDVGGRVAATHNSVTKRVKPVPVRVLGLTWTFHGVRGRFLMGKLATV